MGGPELRAKSEKIKQETIFVLACAISKRKKNCKTSSVTIQIESDTVQVKSCAIYLNAFLSQRVWWCCGGSGINGAAASEFIVLR